MRVALAAIIVTACSIARAETVAERAENLFNEGLALKDRGKLVEACDRFRKAVELAALPGAKLNLAECAEHEGQYLRAWTLYTEAERAYRQSSQPQKAAVARGSADGVKRKLVTVKIAVADTDVAGLVITIAQHPVPLARTIEQLADPGTIEITAAAPNHETFVERKQASAGDTITFEIPTLAGFGQRPAEPAMQTHRRRSWLYVSGGLALGALASGAAGTAFFVDAYRSNDTSEADVATVFGVVGIGLGAAAIYTFVTAPRDPVLVPTTNGVALRARF